jgi:hypothetical protein
MTSKISSTHSSTALTGRKRALSEEKFDPLHTVGYKVYKSAFKVPEPLLEEVKRVSQNATEIFNYNETKRNDYKRLETTIAKNKCKKVLKEFLNSLDAFVEQKISNVLTPSKWSVIRSKGGCQDQAPHCDIVPSLPLALAPDAQMPLSVIVALMPGTRLNIWPNSIKMATLSGRLLTKMEPIACEVLGLDAGDVLVFRGDFIHAGSSYSKDNYRLHTFLDSDLVPREPNTTWTVHQDGEPPLKKIIVPRGSDTQ